MPEDGEPITVRRDTPTTDPPAHTPGAVVSPGDQPAGDSMVVDEADNTTSMDEPVVDRPDISETPPQPEEDVEDSGVELPADGPTTEEPLKFDESSFDTEADTDTEPSSFTPENTEPTVPNESDAAPVMPAPAPVMSQKPKKSSSKAKVLVVMLVILAAALAGGGVWFWQQQEIKGLKDDVANLQNQLVAAQNQEPEEEAEETETEEAVPSGFASLTNEDLGISVNHPEDWANFVVTAQAVDGYLIETTDQAYKYNTATKQWENTLTPLDRKSEVEVVRLDEEFTVWTVATEDAEGCAVNTYYLVVDSLVGSMETPAVCASDNATQEADLRNTLVFSIKSV